MKCGCRHRRVGLVMLSLFLAMATASAQKSFTRSCPDFLDLNSDYVTCYTGHTDDPFQETGVVRNRHTIIDYQGSDPHTGSQLPYLPPGESAVIRLGNEHVGAEAEAITYRFLVDYDRAILLLNFAVVLEDPGHDHIAQPRFVVRVTDLDGNLVDPCAEYDVSAREGIEGFNTFGDGLNPVRWRPWTMTGIDLSPYVGKVVELQFITYDCDYSGHFGYAYFTATCVSNRLDLVACDGDEVTLQAPPYFEDYRWDNGGDGQSCIYNVQNAPLDANCQITSATGCQFTLSAHISNDANLPIEDFIVVDTICQGEAYHDNYFDLPIQDEPGDFTFVTTFFDPVHCQSGASGTLRLTVIQRYWTYEERICQGLDYVDHDFQISAQQLQDSLDAHPGRNVFDFTNLISFNETCDRYQRLRLTVDLRFESDGAIVGDSNPCVGSLVTYHLEGAEDSNDYEWIVGDNARIFEGQYATTAVIYFTDNNPSTLRLRGYNGCGEGYKEFVVTPRNAYHDFYNDTVCSGYPYEKNGFLLPVQDEVGMFVYTVNEQTSYGCDSVRVLQLTVTDSPTLEVVAEEETLCDGDGTIIHAFGEHAIYQGGITLVPPVALGDILCTDGSFVKPADYEASGKTAKGVVFYVDATDLHGYAVNLHNDMRNAKWLNGQINLNGLPDKASWHEAINDFEGFGNTAEMRNNNSPAALAVDFNNGWFIPAAGQLNLLWNALYDVDATLQLLGGDRLTDGTSWNILSSTEKDGTYAWGMNYSSVIRGGLKDGTSTSGCPNIVRSIINF